MDASICVNSREIPLADDEAELIERARHDRDAFARLYRNHYAGVLGYLYRRTGDSHAAEDLVSEVFISAMQGLPRYQHRGTPFRYWLLPRYIQ